MISTDSIVRKHALRMTLGWVEEVCMEWNKKPAD